MHTSPPRSLTHNTNKEVSEDKGANPDPEEDVGAGEGSVGNLDQITVDLVPLVQCEELEEGDHGIGKGAGWMEECAWMMKV